MGSDISDDGPVDEAVMDFADGFNCAQAVLAAFADRHGLPRETAQRVACAFGAGMGVSGGTCGAVTGALMHIGLTRRESVWRDGAGRAEAKALAAEFCQGFQERHGSVICSQLLGVEMETPAGRADAAARGLFTSQCPKYVEDAARILVRVLSR